VTATADPAAPATAPEERKPGWGRRLLNFYLYGNAVVVTILALLCALVVGAVLIVIADQDTRASFGYFFAAPGDTIGNAWAAIVHGYGALFRGAVFDPGLASSGVVGAFTPISNTLLNATPLILGGLAVGVAFRTGLFNIGVQGQMIVGAIFSGYVAFAWQLPHVVHLVVALAAGVVGGALWGGVAGWLKARTGAHEVITTIMLNYIALYLLVYLLGVKGFQAPGSNQAISRRTVGTARLPHLFGPDLRVHLGLVIALLAALGVWWLLTRSTLGFSLRAVGANPFAARTAGMGIERSYLVVMLISGALAGLAGCSQILGTNSALTGDIDAGIGFDAITVALLGAATPSGTVLAGLLFGAFRAGSVVMATDTSTPSEIVSIIEPVLVLFIAAPALIRGIFRLRAARRSGVGSLAKGWNG
jgi:general nucleoside transport system permease protein